MASSKVGASAPTGKKTMLPVHRSAAVANPSVNKVSSGKSTSKLGTTMHKAGCTGTTCSC